MQEISQHEEEQQHLTGSLQLTNSRTLVASVFHEPAGDADDVLKNGLGQVFQHHLLLDLQLLVHADGIQDEDGGNGFTVAGQEAAEFALQQLFPLLEACFLQKKTQLGNFPVILSHITGNGPRRVRVCKTFNTRCQQITAEFCFLTAPTSSS